MTPPTILLLAADAATRVNVADALSRGGMRPLACKTVREAAEVARRTPDEIAVLVLDADTLRFELPAWMNAGRADPRFEKAPVVLLARDGVTDRPQLANLQGVVRHGAGLASVVTAVAQAARAPTPGRRLALGSDRLTTGSAASDLHGYAYAKLVTYLGEERAIAAMRHITVTMPGRRITTPKDLRDAASRLSALGDLEATVATLLTGRAILLEGDRTLRK